jgi:hypothetical protein
MSLKNLPKVRPARSDTVPQRSPLPALPQVQGGDHAPDTVSHAFSRVRVGGPTPLLSVQARLEVGAPDDRYEQEAERVAEAVMTGSERKQWETPGAGGAPPQIQRMCASCEDEDKAQLAPLEGTRPEPTTDLEARVTALRDGGEPLPELVRQRFERSLGHDFARVRIHTGHHGATLSRSLGARALTMGQHIAFAPGQYSPESSAGQRLLAHELTHVVQQTGGSTQVPRAMPSSTWLPPPQSRDGEGQAS